ncbi:DUF2972 domain-containing protein [Campylobacter sp. LH-2024]|uniref:DUF2972 domain-containing protein n=2 Tax=Campylobacter TaxID=194 RepID=UPI003B81A7C1
MHNPNSAVERIKNHLAYKLGQAMIEYNKNGGGYLSLFKKLYNIKKQHKKEKQIYQETIKVFPTLKYPELKQCPDYNEALKCYFHLSYMLGEVLIKADQDKFIGGYFNLNKYIKKAKKEFKLFQDIFKEFDQINSNVIKAIVNNKQLFLKELPRIKNLLNTHKDYQPIIDNIFHNFDYVIKKINLIEEWLLSNDFNEKYKKENHPYPSLLDPKKLNDEKEEINYKTIPAQLAWEMNLPLPDNYEFVFWGSHGVGNFGFSNFMKKLDMICIYYKNNDPILDYCDCYNKLLLFKKINGKIYFQIREYFNQKNYYLIDVKNNLCLVRDPISILKTFLNLNRRNINFIDELEFDFSVNVFLKNRIAYVDEIGKTEKPTLNAINRILENHGLSYYFHDVLSVKLLNIKNTYFIDMSEILHDKTYQTLCRLNTIFNIKKPNIKDSKFYKHNFGEYNTWLPIKINLFNLIRKKIIIIIDDKYKALDYKESNYIKLNKFFNFKLDKFIILLDKSDQNLFFEHTKPFKDRIKKYLNNLFSSLEKQKNIEKNKKLIEEDILLFFKNNHFLRKKFMQIMNTNHLSYIKQHRPDIVASWKYYQEFEKMCEELDG